MLESEQLIPSGPPGRTSNIRLENLPGLLRDDLEHVAPHLYVLVDMGRLRGDLREEVIKKLDYFKYLPLLDKPQYQHLKPFGAFLVFAPDDDHAALLDEWGGCDSEIVSAWLLSQSQPRWLAAHFRQGTFAYEPDGTRYLLRYYDPKTTPILHRVADRQWVRWFFGPVAAWWYPVATPAHESWSRIEGEGKLALSQRKRLILTEELLDALQTDPFPYHVLNALEQEFPASFGSNCYGVRLAQVENLLQAGKESGLEMRDDQFIYARAIFENPARAGQPDWQAAVQNAAAGKAPLSAYFTQA